MQLGWSRAFIATMYSNFFLNMPSQSDIKPRSIKSMWVLGNNVAQYLPCLNAHARHDTMILQLHCLPFVTSLVFPITLDNSYTVCATIMIEESSWGHTTDTYDWIYLLMTSYSWRRAIHGNVRMNLRLRRMWDMSVSYISNHVRVYNWWAHSDIMYMYFFLVLRMPETPPRFSTQFSTIMRVLSRAGLTSAVEIAFAWRMREWRCIAKRAALCRCGAHTSITALIATQSWIAELRLISACLISREDCWLSIAIQWMHCVVARHTAVS